MVLADLNGRTGAFTKGGGFKMTMKEKELFAGMTEGAIEATGRTI